MKKCLVCKIEKILSEFYFIKKYLSPYCKSCTKEKAKISRNQNSCPKHYIKYTTI